MRNATILALGNLVSGALQPVNTIFNEVPPWFVCTIVQPVFTSSSATTQFGKDICDSIKSSRIPVPNISSHFYEELAYKIFGGVLAAFFFAFRAAPALSGAARRLAKKAERPNPRKQARLRGGRGVAVTDALMHGARFLTRVLPTKGMVLGGGALAIYGGLHDYTHPDEPSVLESVGYGAACVGIVGLAVAYTIPVLVVSVAYIVVSTTSSYVAYKWRPNSVEMVLRPQLAGYHSELHAGSAVIALLGDSMGQSVTELRGLVNSTRVLSASLPNDPCSAVSYIPFVDGWCRDFSVMGALHKSWTSKLTHHLNNTISGARQANKIVILSTNETVNNATHVGINCETYSAAMDLLDDIRTEQSSLVIRLWEGLEGMLETIGSFFGTASGPHRLCYDNVRDASSLHTSSTTDSLDLA